MENGDSKEVSALELFNKLCAFRDIFQMDMILIFENLSIFLIIFLYLLNCHKITVKFNCG